MAHQFLGYLHHNKYRNDFKITGATSEIDYDYKRLDALQSALEDIYEDDGFIVQIGDVDWMRERKAFDLLISRLKDEAQFWLEKHGEISSKYLACSRNTVADVYDSAELYIEDVVAKIQKRVERDDGQWDWDCFVEGLQYLLDDMLIRAAGRHPDLPAPTMIRVAARNIDWRGRSGQLVCEAKAETLLRKITGNHNSPSYTFYWGDQQMAMDDYGDLYATSSCEFLHMVMPHHDATTHADIEAVWSANPYDSDDYIAEEDVPAARQRFAALLSIVDRIYGGDQYDRMFGEKIQRPAIYRLMGFDSRGLVDRGMKVVSERCAEEHIDYLLQDVWFDIKQNYDTEHPTRLATDEVNGYTAAYWSQHVTEFAEKFIAVLAMIEQDDIAQESGDE